MRYFSQSRGSSLLFWGCLGLVATLLLSLSTLDARPLQGAAALKRWSYCDVSQNSNGTVSFRGKSQYVNAETWLELATKLGMANPESSSMFILNGLGERGWEMVTATETTLGESLTRTWTFKRTTD